VSSTESEDIKARAAWLYYMEGLTQDQVAKVLNLTRTRVLRMLASAREDGTVQIRVTAPIARCVRLEREVRARFDMERVVVVPDPQDEARLPAMIGAALGQMLPDLLAEGMTIGLGWGRTLLESLPYVEARALEEMRVVSLLGGIAQAHRFNPAEFAWRFAQIFNGDAFLITAPAIVDSVETKTALIERCGLSTVLDMADQLDMVVLSVGGIESGATTYRTGYIAESDRRSLQAAGAVGDLLFHFLDSAGELVDHPINARIMSADMAAIRRAKTRVIASGGADKIDILRASLAFVRPTVLVTDELTAARLLEDSPD
jgi:DNA-binding transcriptional regulator LsrR (DeoR family)